MPRAMTIAISPRVTGLKAQSSPPPQPLSMLWTKRKLACRQKTEPGGVSRKFVSLGLPTSEQS
jgi:hypothetical protein